MAPLRTNSASGHVRAVLPLVPVFFLAACATPQSLPRNNPLITFRFRFPAASTARVFSKTNIQSSWPQYENLLDETIEEVSQLRFGGTAKNRLEHPESNETANDNSILYENLRLEHNASFRPPVLLTLLQRMHFNFALDTSGGLASFDNLQLDPQSLKGSKTKKTSPFHLRFARESAWPAWLKTLSGQTVQPGKAIQFEVKDYPIGCLGPSATTRTAALKVTENMACPDAGAASDSPALGEQQAQQCVRIELNLTANQASIIQNIKDTLGPGNEDILDSLALNEATCIDTIKALMNPQTMRLFQADYTSKDNLSAANSTFKHGKQVIKSKVLFKSTQYEWDDNR